jgi:hypothetical protein
MDIKGYQRRILFDNGYGLSIVCHDFSYGGEEGLFEIALLDAEDERIIYVDSLGFSDVIGHLDFSEVAEIIDKIKKIRK